MSIATQITRIQQDRNTIRTKLVELGLATNTDNLDVLAEAISGIEDNGSVSVNVKEGETYTIPAGFHDGSGTVSGVAGGGNYTLQSKAAITPTKKSQHITPDDGYYGLSDVTIAAIPDAYQDVTAVTAAAGDVLTGKTIVAADGQIVAGTMANNGAVDKTLTAEDTSFTVAAGYHNGSGVVKVVTEDKSIVPTEAAQDVVASAGKILKKVTVEAIPARYADTTDATATADKILVGETAYVLDNETQEAVKIEGTMADNAVVNKTLTTADANYTVPAGYHNGSGKVQIVPEDKSVTPTKSAQTVTATEGKVLNKVSVAAIPDAYQDVTAVDASATDVLTGKTIVAADGSVVEGSMANNGAVTKTLDATTGNQSYVVPMGYHNGEGAVSIVLEEKTVTPTKNAQNIIPTAGKVLSKVAVAAIPAEYQDVTAVDAGAEHVLDGKKIVAADGSVVTGSMVNNGAVTATIDGLTVMNYTIPAGYHDGTGTVSLTSDIEDALAAI